MSGSAPFGRDDQPLLEVRIVGGKRVEIEVDKYGTPLNLNDKSSNKGQPESRFSRSISEGHNANSYSPRNTAVPPWVRGETPPKKIIRPLESPKSASTRQSSISDIGDLPGIILPSITRKHDRVKNEDAGDESDRLSEVIKAQVQGMDTSKLRDAYLTLCGFDSTFTGFVDKGQIEQVFTTCGVPIHGAILKALNSKFMSARRPNWVNYEQLLKFINNVVKGGKVKDVDVPKLDLSLNSGDLARTHLAGNLSCDSGIPLKPNQLSPRSNGSLTGRQSAIIVKRAFQDRQDAHLLIEMERMLKPVPKVRDLIWRIQETLEQNDPQSDFISSQKLKTICLRHHLPFNGSLLDKILDRLDPKDTRKVNWQEFMAFVERAQPIDEIPNQETSSAGSRGSMIETPPMKPMWETRKPLGAVLPGRNRVMPEAGAAMEQEQLYDEQKKTLGESSVQQTLQGLEEQHRDLLRQQYHLIEQKRKIQKDQEEFDKFVTHDDEVKPVYEDSGSCIQRFLCLANALFLSDDKGSGYLDIQTTRRLVKNYNLVYHLEFTTDVIEDAINICSTPDGMVSVDYLLKELKKYI